MFLFIFLNIDLYFLITAAIAQIFNSATKLVILIGAPTKEAKAEIKTHPVFTETKKRKCSV